MYLQVSPLLTVEVHSIKASALHSKLSHLILSHYDLASTTVTGIPMKEEQNASSSANYDVEIFHSSSAHTAILKGIISYKIYCRNLFAEIITSFQIILYRKSTRLCINKNFQTFRGRFRIRNSDVKMVYTTWLQRIRNAKLHSDA